ncbi:Os07g0546150, partial [Oryza sativa Japonica Group]
MSLHHHWDRHRRRRWRGGFRRVPPPGDHLLHGARLRNARRRPDLTTAAAAGGRTHRRRGRSRLPPRPPGVPGPGSGGPRSRGWGERRGRRGRAARRGGGLEGRALVLVEVAADAGRVGEERRDRGRRRRGSGGGGRRGAGASGRRGSGRLGGHGAGLGVETYTPGAEGRGSSEGMEPPWKSLSVIVVTAFFFDMAAVAGAFAV